VRSRFISDLQDPLSRFSTGGEDSNFLPVSYYLAASHSGGGAPVSTSPVNLPTPTPNIPDESIEAQAAQNGSGGPGSVVAVTSGGGGITINLMFDAAAMAAPASFRAGIQQAASILSATITNKITVNINIDYSGTGGGAAAGPDSGQFVSYSTVRTDLINNAAPGDTTFNALPTGSKIQAQSSVAVWNAQLKLFGLLGANDTTTDDGSATFATDISPNLLVGVALHELTHALGRVPYGSQPDIFDLYRFTSVGTYLFANGNTAPAAYFSLDGGNTKIADFGRNSDPSDFLNSGVQGSNDPFDEFYGGSTLQSLTTADKEQLDALGFNTVVSTAGISVAPTASKAVQGGALVTLLSATPNITDPASTTLSGATIKIANAGGNAVAGDQLFVNGVQNGSVGNGVTASWNASTGTLTLTGGASIAIYDALLSEVSYQDTGTDTSSGSHPVRTVTWTVNDGTNSYTTTSQIVVDRVPVATNDVATNVVGSTVTVTAASGVLSNDTDLDGDKLTVTGISDVTKGAGSVGAPLAGVYGHLTLNGDGSYSYVADISAALNSAPTGSHLLDSFTYTASDGNGGTATKTLTVTLDRLPVVTAANVALGVGQASVAASSLFTASDPDGNAITTYGFMDTGTGHFVLNGVVQANNQEIDVTAAQLSQLTYQSIPGSPADTLEVRVSDGTLWSIWTSFTVTPPLVVIQTDGSTSLVQVGSNYFLDPVGGSSGPELKFGGSPVVPGVGQFSGWAAIGAVQTASGYDVAWKDAATNQYAVWTTDSNGNFVSSTGAIAATGTTLETLERTFNQDLNGDGVIGIPITVIQTDGSTSLAQAGSNYFLDPVGGSSGPELKFGGVPVVPNAGQFAGWAAIGAVQTASGYDVAWKDAATNQYAVWTTDSNGNFVSSTGAIAAISSTLEIYETTLNQDLNGDGVIGIPTVVIQTDGSTSLVQVASNYFLDPVGTLSGPELKFDGVPVVPNAGQFAGWAAIGAVQTSSGYDVAWKDAATNQYAVWTTDSSGNFVSSTGAIAANSAALETYETTFNQDLNGDGMIGIPTVVIHTDGSTSLVQVGSNYFLDPVGTLSGPELKFGGVPVVPNAGQFAGWAAIGAVQTSSGYDVAWKDAATNQYAVWTTDNNGNFVSSTGAIAATSTTLETYESTFNQDLNGDGIIGIPVASVKSATSSSAVLQEVSVKFASADTFVFGWGSHTGDLPNPWVGENETWVARNHPAEFLHNALASQWQAQASSMIDGHDNLINPSHHDGLAAVNFHLTDLHSSHFVFG
jgi:VCBS repeat-containing protein